MKRRIFKEYSLILLGTLLLALGMNIFLVPMKLSSGGVGSIGTVLLYTLNIPLSVTNLAFNAVLFIFGFKMLGKVSVIKTLAGTLFLSLFLELTKYIRVPITDMLICVIAGGVCVGLGIGLVVRVGGSTGGSDFAGLMIKRAILHVSVADIILAIDFIIIVIAGAVFGDFTISFYSSLCMYISSKVSDRIINIGNAAKAIYITAGKSDEIKDIILKKFERGVTEIYTQGGYSREKRLMLFCVVSPKEAPRLVKEIKATDDDAFIIISDAREVLGEGFEHQAIE